MNSVIYRIVSALLERRRGAPGACSEPGVCMLDLEVAAPDIGERTPRARSPLPAVDHGAMRERATTTGKMEGR